MTTHLIETQWSQGNQQVTDRVTLTGDGESNIEVSVPDASTDMLANLNIDISLLQSLYMVSDQDLTVETNDGTTPDDTFSLKAGKPLVWYPDSYHPNPFSLDVTKLYLTNSSGSAAILTVKTLQDVTP